MNTHPLDHEDDTDIDFDYSSVGNERVYRHEGLFKASVRGAVVAAILVFISSVVLINTQFPSPGWSTVFWVNRLTMLLLLMSFVGLLLSFQLQNLIRFRNRLAEPNRSRSGTFPDQAVTVLWPRNSLLFLVGANGAFLIVLWLVIGFTIIVESTILFWLIQFFSFFLSGLLINIILWNRGYWRAFAAGALPIAGLWLVFVLAFMVTGLYSGAMYPPQLGSDNLRMLNILTGMIISMAAISGLIGAAYLQCLRWFRIAVDQDNPEEADLD